MNFYVIEAVLWCLGAFVLGTFTGAFLYCTYEEYRTAEQNENYDKE